jgi:hypothetical protein
MSINSTITTYQRSGGQALDRVEPMLTRGPTVARATAIGAKDRVAPPPRSQHLSSLEDYRQIIVNFDPRVHTISKVEPALLKLCVPPGELRAIGERAKLAIKVYQLAANKPITGKLTTADLASLNNIKDCPAGDHNYYESVLMGPLTDQAELFDVGLAKDRQLRPGASEFEIRSRIPELRQSLAASLKLQSPLLSDQVTPDLIAALTAIQMKK